MYQEINNNGEVKMSSKLFLRFFFLGGWGGGGAFLGALKPITGQCLFSGFGPVKLSS